MAEPIVNNYEKRTVSRVVFGVAAALLSMGIPIGLTEFFRPGGDRGVAFWCAVATALAAVCAFISIRGMMEE